MNEAADLTGAAITGLTNGTTYDVFKLVTGADSGTTSLDGGEYNTVVDITTLGNGDDHTIEAGSSKPAAKSVIVFVGQVLEKVAAVVIDEQEIEGATLDYTFGTTTADGAKLSVQENASFIILDLGGLTGTTFTTTITVKTAAD
jgi:hypothetical protein